MSSTYKFSPGLFLDIELPSTAQDGSTRPPVIVWGHGGGWRLHDRTARPNFARAFAPQGFAMVSIYYRLAPAGTIHSFSFHTHNTHMLGILTTPLFEKFFDYMNVPSDFAVQEKAPSRGSRRKDVARRKPNSTSPSWARRHSTSRHTRFIPRCVG